MAGWFLQQRLAPPWTVPDRSASVPATWLARWEVLTGQVLQRLLQWVVFLQWGTHRRLAPPWRGPACWVSALGMVQSEGAAEQSGEALGEALLELGETVVALDVGHQVSWAQLEV